MVDAPSQIAAEMNLTPGQITGMAALPSNMGDPTYNPYAGVNDIGGMAGYQTPGAAGQGGMYMPGGPPMGGGMFPPQQQQQQQQQQFNQMWEQEQQQLAMQQQQLARQQQLEMQRRAQQQQQQRYDEGEDEEDNYDLSGAKWPREIVEHTGGSLNGTPQTFVDKLIHLIRVPVLITVLFIILTIPSVVSALQSVLPRVLRDGLGFDVVRGMMQAGGYMFVQSIVSR